MTNDAIQQMLDRHSIHELLVRHGAYFDEGNISAMEELWAPDCVTDYGAARGGLVIGRDAFMSRLSGAAAHFRWTHHQLGHSLIDFHEHEAVAMTPMLCWHETIDGERYWISGRYEHKFRRDEDHRWMISYRRMIVTGAEGQSAKDPWIWLDRKLSTPDG
jgi:hypothetical protein